MTANTLRAHSIFRTLRRAGNGSRRGLVVYVTVNVVGNLRNEGKTFEMRTKEKLNYIWLLVPVLLFAGAQIFALTAADGRVPANTASPNTQSTESKAAVKSHADVVISDRGSIMKSLKLGGFRLPGCVDVDCAAPPPGCTYQGPPATDDRGCPINCGTLVCDGSGN
jgi:hypothetical protein